MVLNLGESWRYTMNSTNNIRVYISNGKSEVLQAGVPEAQTNSSLNDNVTISLLLNSRKHKNLSQLISSIEKNETDKLALQEKRKELAERYLKGTKSLAAIRLSAGLSQVGLAEAVNTSQSWVARLEKGEQNLTFDKMKEVSEVLGINPSEFVETYDQVRNKNAK